MRLSKNFSLSEFIRSQVAIRYDLQNMPGPGQVLALQALCREVLEPIREHWGPVSISSGYRSEQVNKLIGGAPTSQHTQGEAADFYLTSHPEIEIFQGIKASTIPFDQLIFEGRWIHVSHKPNGPQRRETLRAIFENGKVKYDKA